MSYHLRDRIPCDYEAMHAGQHVDDDQDEFHDSFQYQPLPAPVLPSTSQVQPSQYSLFGDSDQYECPKWRRSCTNRRDCTGKSREWSSGTRDRGGPPESRISHPPTTECTTTKAETAKLKSAKLKSYHQDPSRQSGSHCTRVWRIGAPTLFF